MSLPGPIVNEKLPISSGALICNLCFLFPIPCLKLPPRLPHPPPPFAPAAASTQTRPAVPHTPRGPPWPSNPLTQQSTSQSLLVPSSLPPCSNRLDISIGSHPENHQTGFFASLGWALQRFSQKYCLSSLQLLLTIGIPRNVSSNLIRSAHFGPIPAHPC
jgi:hypothetical protein